MELLVIGIAALFAAALTFSQALALAH